MTVSLDGRVAVVTGAGRGIGRAHALLLSRLGAKLVVNDLGASPEGSGTSPGPANEIVEEIRAAGGEAVSSTDDITDPAGSALMVARALDAFGRVDILVNNAGIMVEGSVVTTSLDDIQRLVQVNLFGPIYAARAALPHMLAQRHGRIIFTSSTSGLFGRADHTIYSAAKTGLIGLMNCMAQDCQGTGVLVNTIVPGAATRLSIGRMWEEVEKFMDPGKISPLVAWLSSDQCDANGELFNAIGGHFSRAMLVQNDGIQFDPRREFSTEMFFDRLAELRDMAKTKPYLGTMRSLRKNLDDLGLISRES